MVEITKGAEVRAGIHGARGEPVIIVVDAAAVVFSVFASIDTFFGGIISSLNGFFFKSELETSVSISTSLLNASSRVDTLFFSVHWENTLKLDSTNNYEKTHLNFEHSSKHNKNFEGRKALDLRQTVPETAFKCICQWHLSKRNIWMKHFTPIRKKRNQQKNWGEKRTLDRCLLKVWYFHLSTKKLP